MSGGPKTYNPKRIPTVIYRWLPAQRSMKSNGRMETRWGGAHRQWLTTLFVSRVRCTHIITDPMIMILEVDDFRETS